MVKVRRSKERREFVPENFKEVKLKVAIDSMGKAKVSVLKENGVIDRYGVVMYCCIKEK